MQQPCAQVKELARRHLHDVDRKIRELELLRKQLQMLLRRGANGGQRSAVCPLIEQAHIDKEKHRFTVCRL